MLLARLITKPRNLHAALCVFALMSLGACDDDPNQTQNPITEPETPTVEPVPEEPAKLQPSNPEVSGPVTGGGGENCCFILGGVDLRDQGYTPGTPFYAGVSYDEAEVGYIESEYFIKGTATAYSPTNEWKADGTWAVQESEFADYNSRIVVLRPNDPNEFNGTVILEWFNVSGDVDAAPDLLQTHVELVREGYTWVGVSAQKRGVDENEGLPLHLTAVDPVRYDSLFHPGDSFSYDIFSQAAQAVRRPTGLEPLNGLNVERMLAIGQSQSAIRMVTYINAVHPTLDLFDGFLVHGRNDDASPLSQDPLPSVGTPNNSLIRDDVTVPVLLLQTEGDVIELDSSLVRQPDADNIRLWEVAGGAHADLYTTITSTTDKGQDSSVFNVKEVTSVRPPFIDCSVPVNDGPSAFVTRAAIAALDQWVRTGQAPISSELLPYNRDQRTFELDSVGNVTGGIRTPWVDAPVSVLSGARPPGSSAFCALYGSTRLLDEATLAALYPTSQDYIDAVDASTDDAIAKGHLRPADGELIKEQARSQAQTGG